MIYNKSNIRKMPEFFDRYIVQVEEDDLMQAFTQSIVNLENVDMESLGKIQHKTYAPGKWTINEVFQHVLDFERILSYRTLLFARKFSQAQPPIDEDVLAGYSNANKRFLIDIIDELKAVRNTNMMMFSGFDEEALQNVGWSWKYEISVLAMGFNLVGHQNHHLRIIRERYSDILV